MPTDPVAMPADPVVSDSAHGLAEKLAGLPTAEELKHRLSQKVSAASPALSLSTQTPTTTDLTATPAKAASMRTMPVPTHTASLRSEPPRNGQPVGNPQKTITIQVPRNSLRAVVANGLKKTNVVERHLPIRLTRWVSVEAAEQGTNDSVFFVPETPTIHTTHERAQPAQYIKVSPRDAPDVVCKHDAFQLEFVGMSVAPMDVVGNNDLMLCSLTRKDGILPDSMPVNPGHEEMEDLPTAMTVQPGDIPYLHFDPDVDGHDTGAAPDSFLPIPGMKRVYLQRSGGPEEEGRDVGVRFTVMEIDKLSEEQLIAIKSLDEIGKSVGKAAATVPYLKIISWILEFANYLGSPALKKVAEPDHVLSKDISFILADEVAEDPSENSTSANTKREEYGNYLRYGYYFFLSSTVDAKLYAQTGASSQQVQLLLHRAGYNPKFASRNEREFFPLTGVSYVVMKVSRGCAQLDVKQRSRMLERHRERIVKLLKKHTGKLGDASAEEETKKE